MIYKTGDRTVAAPLHRLGLWLDLVQRPVAAQMALDEALLQTGRAVLRLHGWSDSCVTFGYFLRWRELRERVLAANLDEHQAIRRWSGGGLVFHGNDLAFTLAIPADQWRGVARFRDSQANIHRALAAALNQHGWPVSLVDAECGDNLDCFRHPVEFDLELAGRKIVGAGQRRCREGLLHQGSLQLPEAGLDWAATLAQALAHQVEIIEPDSGETSAWLARSEVLLPRYLDSAWRRKR